MTRTRTDDRVWTILIPLVRRQHLLRNLDILHHSLGGFRKRSSRFDLEFRQHSSFCVVRHRATRDESFREMTVVVFFKNVLLRQKSEERDRFVEDDIDFCFGFLLHNESARDQPYTGETTDSFQTLFEILVDKERNVLWRLQIRVDEYGECLHITRQRAATLHGMRNEPR